MLFGLGFVLTDPDGGSSCWTILTSINVRPVLIYVNTNLLEEVRASFHSSAGTETTQHKTLARPNLT